MKTEKIEKLFEKYSAKYLLNSERELPLMPIEEFFFAINQAEKEMKLEWFKELHTKLNAIFSQPTAKGVELELSKYIIEIKNKIKELENGI